MRRMSLNIGGIFALSVGCIGSAGSESISEPGRREVLAPNTLVALPGQDFRDDRGRLWRSNGKVVLAQRSVADDAKQPKQGTYDNGPLTRELLAERLRPRRLVGDYEYELVEPDYDLADKILAMKSAPSRDAQPPLAPRSDLAPKWIFSPDGRYSTNSYAASWYESTFGKVSQNCTATMIGRSTALSAAHCYYQQGIGWIATNSIAFGASNSVGTVSTPFGSYVFDSITLPGAWFGGNWDWDFAVLEFSPTRYPGDQTGTMGYQWSMSGAQYIIGYPTDKLQASQWGHGDSYFAAAGPRYKHYIDVYGGESGACVFNSNLRCTGIQSTQLANGSAFWNEVRRWDNTTYAFFDTYGNFP
jgi:V8-like Glu-specific endopeptidase